jgi:hypothetical protein
LCAETFSAPLNDFIWCWQRKSQQLVVGDLEKKPQNQIQNKNENLYVYDNKLRQNDDDQDEEIDMHT